MILFTIFRQIIGTPNGIPFGSEFNGILSTQSHHYSTRDRNPFLSIFEETWIPVKKIENHQWKQN